MSDAKYTGMQIEAYDEAVKVVTAKIIEDARSGGIGYHRMTKQDAQAIAAVIREYWFQSGLSASRAKISTTNPDTNPV